VSGLSAMGHSSHTPTAEVGVILAAGNCENKHPYEPDERGIKGCSTYLSNGRLILLSALTICAGKSRDIGMHFVQRPHFCVPCSL
jgi:hypothetical protein